MITHPDDLETDLGHVRDLLAGSIGNYQMEKRYFHKEGHIVYVQLSVSLFRDAEGAPLYFIKQVKDITQRKEDEEQTKASLREKEVLLKEIHHRVKNNLQIVSTLLDLQSEHTQDQQAQEMFKESRGRAKSMALIHERLYRSQDLARVNFNEYIQQLAQDLYHAYRLSSDEIVLHVEVAAPPLPIDIAIPCGLLLNELMSNCLKHAFAHTPDGWIRVTLYSERGIRVNCVAPGPIWTPLQPVSKPPEAVAKHGADTPLGRPGQPEEVAPSFVFFASDADSSYINGEILTLLGGEVRAG